MPRHGGIKMSYSVEIRPAALADAERLSEIYAPYVEKTVITFEYQVPSPSEFEKRIASIISCYPYLVAITDGKIQGYAYAAPFKERAAYAWSAETSVYIDMDFRGQGIGSLLYRQLEDMLKAQNICNLCACITYPNPQSIGFHQHMGYGTVAHFHKSGYKFNAWHDIVWMEKFINPHPSDQKPFIPAKEVL